MCLIITISLNAIGAAEESLSSTAGKNSPSLSNPFMPQLPKPKVEVKPIESPKPPPPKQLTILAPQPSAPTKPPTVVIKGLVWNSDRPQAIVNDQVVDIGDKIGEMEIVSINKTGIDFLYQGEKITVTP